MADDITKNVENIQKIRRHLRFQPLRFVHIFFSIILALFGTAILLATLTVKLELSEYEPYLYFYLDKPVLVLIIGSIILVTLGCLGIISSSLNLYHGIVTFGVLLFGIFVFKFTTGAVFLALSNSADRSITEALETHVNNYTEFSEAIDFIQANLSCCGIEDFTDWNSTLGYIPGSCCSSDSACGFSDILNLNETGCYEALKNLVNIILRYLIVVLAALAVLQVTLMIITFFLVRGMSHLRRNISQIIINGSDHREEIAMTHNPLGSENNARRDIVYGGKKSTKNYWQRPTAVGPLIDDNNSRIQNSASPNETNSDSRDNIIRNTIHNENVFYTRSNVNFPRKNRNLSPIAAPPRLPRAHRKFPVGF